MVKLVWPRFQQCLVPVPCYMSKCPLKRKVLDRYCNTYFRVRNFGNTSATSVFFFFFKDSKRNLDFKNEKTSSENVF